MKMFKKLWAHAKDIIRDYRYKVHENAGICFAYYLIMSIFPICSLLSYFASVFNIESLGYCSSHFPDCIRHRVS